MQIGRIFLFSLFTCLIACNNNGNTEQRKDGFTPVLKTQEDSLFHDVMEGHDVGMAKISKVNKYLIEIKSKLDSLSKLPAAKVDANYQQALVDLQEDLNFADYGMTTWMTEFRHDTLKENMDLRVKYLQSEKVKVEQVKKSILTSLERADSLFGKK